MSLFSAVIVYLLIWWVTLFAVLPIGVRGQAEDGNIIQGSEPGAPVHSRMKYKIILTSLISLGIWAIVCLIIISGIIKIEL